MATECKFPFNSEYIEQDDIKYCEEKLNSLPYIDEIRNFVNTGNVEFVNTHIRSLEDLNVLLQSIIYLGLDNYDPILLEFFWKDARSTSSQLLKLNEGDEPSFTWKHEIKNYYFVKQILYQPKKQYLTMAINQTECSCEEAAKRGNLRLLKWLRSKNVPWDKWTCARATLNGHLEVLKWAREHECPWDGWICAWAALNNRLQILKWAHEHGCHWDEYTCVYAARNGHLEVLKWTCEHGCPWDRWACFRLATENGHQKMLEWINGL